MKTTFIKIQFGLYLFIVGTLSFSCSKSFLEEKPRSSLVVPSTLEDFQKLLDNTTSSITMGDMWSTSDLAEASADNYYLSESFYASLPVFYRKVHIWSEDIYEGIGNDKNWNLPYEQIFVTNVVMEGLDKIKATEPNSVEWNRLYGSALFYRTYALFNLSQIFAPPYDEATADIEIGLPLRLTSDVNQIQPRSTIRQTYDQILSDLNKALDLLPPIVDFSNPNRPSRPAGYALLSRVYMSMRDYDKAYMASDECLKLHNKLIDFKTLNQTSVAPIAILNDEVIFHSVVIGSSELFWSFLQDVIIDSVLFSSYTQNDLRKQINFQFNTSGLPYRKNGYSRNREFTGLATDEIYLNKAESLVRKGDYMAGMATLNHLLRYRYNDMFESYTATSAEQALSIILEERRKELVFRGTRWSDLRRLNLEGHNITIHRKINGTNYSLLPNDRRYVLPIPPDEISRSGIIQNIR